MATKKEHGASTIEEQHKPKRKRVRVKEGQLVAVALKDGTFALGHVAKYYYMQVTLAHFAHRATTPEGLLSGVEEALQNKLVAMLAMTHVDIYDGKWPVIGQAAPHYRADTLDTKGRSYLSSMAADLLGAYFGLVPWDEMKDPRFYEKALLPGVSIPSTVRYKRDFDAAAAAMSGKAAGTPAAKDESASPITEGSGVIHIEIKYEGDGLPSIPLLKRRQAIEEGLESAGAGTVNDAGGGGGVMDIYLETQDVARAMPFVQAAIKEAGFENDARIETELLAEDEDEDDDA